MTDTHTKEQRSRNMKAIKSQSKLEEKVSKEIWKYGIRFRKSDKNLFGKPDISIKKYKIVVFVDSCFWHGCEVHGNIPKSNQEYWIKKLMRNKERDHEVNLYYQKRGWHIKRIWEHEIKSDFGKVINELVTFIEKIKDVSGKEKSSTCK